MASDYSFIGAEQVTEFQPPNASQQMIQVTAQTLGAKVVFLHRFLPEVYKNAGSVVNTLDALAVNIDDWAREPAVVAMTPVQLIDASDQLVDKFDVTVQSTSGLSTTVIRVGYPAVDFPAIENEAFAAAVTAAHNELDAVEAG